MIQHFVSVEGLYTTLDSTLVHIRKRFEAFSGYTGGLFDIQTSLEIAFGSRRI